MKTNQAEIYVEKVASLLLFLYSIQTDHYETCSSISIHYDLSDVFLFLFQFEAEFRRFMIKRNEMTMYQDFRMFVNTIHKLNEIQFLISYVDKDGDILPINNDDNYARALSVAEPLLRLILRRKGASLMGNNISVIYSVEF